MKRWMLVAVWMLLSAAAYADAFTFNYDFQIFPANDIGCMCPIKGLTDLPVTGQLHFTPGGASSLSFTLGGQQWTNPAGVFVHALLGDLWEIDITTPALAQLPDARAGLFFTLSSAEASCSLLGGNVCSPSGAFTFHNDDLGTFEIRDLNLPFDFNFAFSQPTNAASVHYLNAITSAPVLTSVVSAPEPSTWILLGSGLIGIFFYRRKR